MVRVRLLEEKIGAILIYLDAARNFNEDEKNFNKRFEHMGSNIGKSYFGLHIFREESNCIFT